MRFFVVILLFSTFLDTSADTCTCPFDNVRVDSGESGIVSQPAYCFRTCTVVAKADDRHKVIHIRFKNIPSDIQVQAYDGYIGNSLVQNCGITSGADCYTSGDTATFVFTPLYPNNGGSDVVNLWVEAANHGVSVNVVSTIVFTLIIYLTTTFGLLNYP